MIFGQARNSGPGAARRPRPISEPSYTVRAQGSGSHPSGVEWVLRNNSSANAAVRRPDQPAPTLYFGQRDNYCAWEGGGQPPQPRPASRATKGEPMNVTALDL